MKTPLAKLQAKLSKLWTRIKAWFWLKQFTLRNQHLHNHQLTFLKYHFVTAQYTNLVALQTKLKGELHQNKHNIQAQAMKTKVDADHDTMFKLVQLYGFECIKSLEEQHNVHFYFLNPKPQDMPPTAQQKPDLEIIKG